MSRRRLVPITVRPAPGSVRARVGAVLAGALLALLAPPKAAADAYPRQPGVDAVHYVFRLELGDGADEIVGETKVRLRFTAAGVREAYLDLAEVRDGKGMSVQSVTLPGVEGESALVSHEHRGDRLRLTLEPPPAAGEERVFTVRYRGVPADGLRFLPNVHGERSVFSESWPDRARQWLPTIDHPSDKATGEMVVTAPAAYQVVSNGRLVEEQDLPDGRRRTHWRQSVPIASWLYALGVARFSVHHAGEAGGVPLQTWVFPQDRERGQALFEELSRSAMAFFSERIGPYPYEKLANVEAAGINGGMESATSIFYGDKGVTASRAPVVHEIAHQWWGNSVTESDWDDVWLSEGFATYFTLLHTEHAEGRDAFAAGLRQSREQILELERKLPDTPVIHRNLSDMKKVLNRLVYQKGGFTLHMLRARIGSEAFWRGIREYYRRFRDGNARTADLREVMEQAAGEPLGWFFEQWLTRAGVPRLEGSWSYDRAAREVELRLAQAQAGVPFRLAVEIGIAPADPKAASRVERIELREREQRFRFAAESEPRAVALDPDVWLLFEPGPFERRR